MEAGNRCFDQRVPEELNRKVLDHLSDINLVLTEHARRYLIAEGIRPETIIKTGSHMREVLNYYGPDIQRSNILNQLGLEPKEYFLVSAHREENVDSEENLTNLIESLNAIAQQYQYPIIVSTHPRTKKKIDALSNSRLDQRINFCKPFGFFDYNKLQMDSYCVVSDSGTITEESSLLGMSAIMIRNAHERPEGLDVGTLIMSGLNPDGVLDAIRIVTSQKFESESDFGTVLDYEAPDVSKKILRIVLSYVDYINRTVWRKS
jgi:UDP-N-acetylglucosamine 2-epimerase (non-hydrolysing)